MAFLLYNQDKWWYKAITVFLILAFIVMISFGLAPRAKALGVLTISVMAAILAVMAGAGIYTVVSGMAAGDMQSWLQGKLNQWDTYRNDGNVFTDLIEENLITVTVKGFLSIGSGAARSITDFINWLKLDLSLSDNSYQEAYVITSGLPVLTTDYLQCTTDIKVRLDNYSGYNVYCVTYNDNTYTGVMMVSTHSFQAWVTRWNSENWYVNAYNQNADGLYVVFNYALPPEQTTYIPYFSSSNLAYQAIYDHIYNGAYPGTGLGLRTGDINIPTITEDKDIHIDIGAYPGISLQNLIDKIINSIIDNILAAKMALVGEYNDAIEAVIINELPIEVNTDHHAFGFVPPEISFDFSSIWHYVEDAIDYSLNWINWFMGMLAAVPVLAIPLYCCFTLVVVLGAFRRFLL